jgi:hypothetical protein
MKEHIDNVITWLKNTHTPEYNVRGCITGSCMLDYFEDQDVDLFVYDEASLRNIFYKMYFNDMFQILDKKEKWKFEEYINSTFDKKPFVYTVKFMYNTCIPVNIILKKNCNSIFQTLASFDLDIVAKGYDLETKQYLDLTNGSTETKIASWNKWNTSYYNPKLWEASKLLRQIGRVVKYYKRGYNTDPLAIKYIQLINEIQSYQNIFDSESFSVKLKIKKENTKIVKQICEVWLDTHEITDEQLELLNKKIKEI